MTIDLEQLTSITGGHAGHDHGPQRKPGSSDSLLWECVMQANRDIASGNPARAALGRSAPCLQLLPK
jgi:hypothetical protein